MNDAVFRFEHYNNFCFIKKWGVHSSLRFHSVAIVILVIAPLTLRNDCDTHAAGLRPLHELMKKGKRISKTLPEDGAGFLSSLFDAGRSRRIACERSEHILRPLRSNRETAG